MMRSRSSVLQLQATATAGNRTAARRVAFASMPVSKASARATSPPHSGQGRPYDDVGDGGLGNSRRGPSRERRPICANCLRLLIDRRVMSCAFIPAPVRWRCGRRCRGAGANGMYTSTLVVAGDDQLRRCRWHPRAAGGGHRHEQRLGRWRLRAPIGLQPVAGGWRCS